MCLQVERGKMVIEWKEWEHSEEDDLAMKMRELWKPSETVV